MMRIFTIILLSIISLSIKAQDPLYDEMTFESEELAKPYKAYGKNFIILKSKRGNEGMPKTSSGDSIKSLNITDIVLVYTENDAGDKANREAANRERWENLIKSYPEYFKENPSLYNTCQCIMGGDAEALKKTQGFYVFIGGKAEAPEPKVVAKKEEPAKAEKKEVATKSKKEEPKEEKAEKPKKVKEEKVAEEKPKKEKKVKEEKTEVAKKEEPAPEPEPVSTKKQKVVKPTYTVAKKAKDPNSCRPPCYEGGDEDLNLFFKENIELSKKEKRHNDELVCKVRLQLNLDGSIKKSFIMGTNEALNKQVEEALKNMSNWNPCVMRGTTVKSDVTITLKYDPENHAMKPFETMITPRPLPKCTCKSDEELGLQ
jgi:hypothetical protein